MAGLIAETIGQVRKDSVTMAFENANNVLFGTSYWTAMETIVQRESGFNPYSQNSSSGAYGLCQSLPANKMATFGSDYLTNPITQINWCLNYVKSRYGNPLNALYFWNQHGWF